MSLPYAKALVPTIVGGLLVLAGSIGVTGTMTIEEFLTYVVMSALVYFVPNKKVEN